MKSIVESGLICPSGESNQAADNGSATNTHHNKVLIATKSNPQALAPEGTNDLKLSKDSCVGGVHQFNISFKTS
ncbi:MAG: hypothetical protein ACOZBL_04765 [Patescibacteria group bacterium]